jgi:hypothetical protein
MSTLISHTSTATKMGMPLNKVSLPINSLPKPRWLSNANEIDHQVNMAFMVAARNHAPSKYQISREDFWSR